MIRVELQAASARRHPLVPMNNERQIVWVIAEAPWRDTHGRAFYRVVIDAGGILDWPEWRKCYADTVELMSPSLYPVRVLCVDQEHVVSNTHCRWCGRSFRFAQHRVRHERARGRLRDAIKYGRALAVPWQNPHCTPEREEVGSTTTP